MNEKFFLDPELFDTRATVSKFLSTKDKINLSMVNHELYQSFTLNREFFNFFLKIFKHLNQDISINNAINVLSALDIDEIINKFSLPLIENELDSINENGIQSYLTDEDGYMSPLVRIILKCMKHENTLNALKELISSDKLDISQVVNLEQTQLARQEKHGVQKVGTTFLAEFITHLSETNILTDKKRNIDLNDLYDQWENKNYPCSIM